MTGFGSSYHVELITDVSERCRLWLTLLTDIYPVFFIMTPIGWCRGKKKKTCFWNTSLTLTCSRTLRDCSAPQAAIWKNGGMQGEEHLVFFEFAQTGGLMDERFTPSQAQIWTYTFVFMGLHNGQSLHASRWIICLSCLMIAHLISVMETD